MGDGPGLACCALHLFVTALVLAPIALQRARRSADPEDRFGARVAGTFVLYLAFNVSYVLGLVAVPDDVRIDASVLWACALAMQPFALYCSLVATREDVPPDPEP